MIHHGADTGTGSAAVHGTMRVRHGEDLRGAEQGPGVEPRVFGVGQGVDPVMGEQDDETVLVARADLPAVGGLVVRMDLRQPLLQP
jgi:hypothetical protein